MMILEHFEGSKKQIFFGVYSIALHEESIQGKIWVKSTHFCGV